jgi:hypothetical protein
VTTSLFFDIVCPCCGGTTFDGPPEGGTGGPIVCEGCRLEYEFETLLKIAKGQALQSARDYVDSLLGGLRPDSGLALSLQPGPGLAPFQ